MKKILFYLLFIPVFGISQVRPPVVTNTISTNNMIWQSDTVKKDSLLYFEQLNSSNYRIRKIGERNWHYYGWTNETFEPNFYIDAKTDSLLHLYKSGSDYYLKIKTSIIDSGKVLYQYGDSAYWILPDSLFKEGLFKLPDGSQIKIGDTLTIPSDTITINNVRLGNNDSITVDSSLFNYVDPGLNFRKTVRPKTDHINIGDDGDIGAAIKIYTGYSGEINGGIEIDNSDGSGSAIQITSGVGLGIDVQNTGNYAGEFYGEPGGIKVVNRTGYSYFESLTKTGDYGLWSDGFTQMHMSGSNVIKDYSLPTSDGDSLDVLTTDGNGNTTFKKPSHKFDSLKVGSGSTISRTGTMAEKDIWTGTQAEYNAIGTKLTTTIYFIHNGYGWIGLIILLLLSLGSRSQNWTAVKIGTTDISKIYKGETVIWEKVAETTAYTGNITVGEYKDINTNYGYYKTGYYDTLVTAGSISPYDDNLFIISFTPNHQTTQVYFQSLPAQTDSVSLTINSTVYWAYWCGADYNYCTNTMANPFPAVGQTCSIQIKYK